MRIEKTCLRGVLLLLVLVMSIITPVLGYDGGGTVNFTIYESDPVYLDQSNVIPFEMWCLLTIIGIVFLTLSIMFYDHAGIVIGFLALGFISVGWVGSVAVGFTQVVPVIVDNSTVLQPVVLTYASLGLNLLMFLLFLVCVLNILLNVLQVFRSSIKPPSYREGGLK